MSELEKAKKDLFGGKYAVSNIKLSIGTNRLATPEEIARELNRSLARLAAGDFTLPRDI